MTIEDVARQMCSLSHVFNGEEFTLEELLAALKRWFNPEAKTQIWFLLIDLPDGEWLMTVNRVGDGFDYYIPDTREQERKLWKKLMRREAER